MNKFYDNPSIQLIYFLMFMLSGSKLEDHRLGHSLHQEH